MSARKEETEPDVGDEWWVTWVGGQCGPFPSPEAAEEVYLAHQELPGIRIEPDPLTELLRSSEDDDEDLA